MSTISAYTGDGSTTQFDITFPYRNASTVKASVDGVETSDFTFVNPSRIEFGTAPASGAEIKIFRHTPVTPPEVEFEDGAIIRGDDLNDAIAQPRDRVEEISSEVASITGAALRAPTGETFDALPAAADRVDKYLAFGGDGAPTVVEAPGSDLPLRGELASSGAGKGAGLVAFDHSASADPGTVADRMKRSVFVTDEPFGAVGDGLTANLTALEAARDFAQGNDLATLRVPDGVYAFGSVLDLAKDHWAVIAEGENATLKHTGSGVAVRLSGPGDDPNYGSYRGTLGGVMPLVIEGNANTTRLLDIDNFHQGFVNVDLKEGQVGVYVADSINNAASAGAVLTRFKVRVSQGNSGAFTTRPATGFYATDIYACQCELLIEHCGGGGNYGVYLGSSAANSFTGTSEGNLTGGVLIAPDSYRNTFTNFFCEFNGTGLDWDIQGDYNTLDNCTGVGSAGNEISGDYNKIIGGKFEDLTITSGAAYTLLDGVDLEGTFTDNSATTTVRNCRLNGVPIADYAPRNGGALGLGTDISDFSLIDSSYQAPAYYRLPDGLGQVLGTFATTGAVAIGAVIATIPSGYRPVKRITFTGYNISTNAVIGFTIDSAGNVVTRGAIGSGEVFAFCSPQFPRS